MMDLPNLFSSTPQKDTLFLGLILTEQTVQAVLWKIAKGDILVIKSSEVVDITDKEKAVVQVDLALQELGELSENLSEVILGLEPSWVNPKGVTDEKKPFLKKITEDLSLKAIGFVVITEAIAQYLSQIHTHLSSVLVFYTQNKISVALVENGLLQKTESVVRSDDAISDLVEALARFKSGHKKELPPSIKLVSINLSEEELFSQQQALIEHDWVKDGYFVSQPTLENLSIDLTINGIIHQGGSAVAKSHGLEVNPPTVRPDTKNEPETPDFNFKEVPHPKEEEIETTQEISTEDANLTAVPKSFGIPISSATLPQIEEKEKISKKPANEQLANVNTVKSTQTTKKTNKLQVWFHHHKKFALIGFISGLIALIFIALVFILISGKAVLTLNLNPKNINKDIIITLDPQVSESNFEELILKSELVKKSFSFSQTNETTGVTLVGEKAKGKIQITNKTDGTKTFPAGTSLASNGIRFTLDDDVTVASASVEIKQDEEVKTYGSTEAMVTAVKIGAEANLESNSTLSIGDFANSTYEAHASENFSGGSSREIRVVSQEDLDTLLADVKKKILELAAQEYKEDSDSDEKLTYISTGNLTVIEQNYSGKEGDEAKTISLEVTAEVDAISFANEDIKPLAQFVLGDLIPEGYQISGKDPQILSAVNEESSSGSAILIDANISSQAIPSVDYDALKHELSGKSITSAQAILDGKADIKTYQINLYPQIMESLWKKIPNKTNKIELKVE